LYYARNRPKFGAIKAKRSENVEYVHIYLRKFIQETPNGTDHLGISRRRQVDNTKLILRCVM